MGTGSNERKHATLPFGLREANTEATFWTSSCDGHEARRRISILPNLCWSQVTTLSIHSWVYLCLADII